MNLKKSPLTFGKGRGKITIPKYNEHILSTSRVPSFGKAPWKKNVAPVPRAVPPAGEDLAQHCAVREDFSEEAPNQILKD